MASIFLSYSHINRDCARALAKTLESAGHDVWWDRRLDGGEEFSAEIEAALDKAEAVVVAWSKESIKSRWVRDEAAAGCEKGMLVPVSIDGSMPPMGFRQFHTMDLSGWKGAKGDERTADLLHAVDRRLHGKVVPPPGAAKATPEAGFQLPGRMPWTAAMIVLVAVLAIGIYTFISRDQPGGPPQKPTIALLSFKSPPADAELGQIASQTRESIAHSFAQSGLPVRLMDSAPPDGGSAVDFLMAGELSRSGEKIVTTVRLEDAAHRIAVFSDRFEATDADLRDLPERIGAQLAGNLTWAAPLSVLDRRHPIEPALMAELLHGADFNRPLDSLQSYQNDKRLAAKAPDLASAQLNVAFSTAFVLAQLPRSERREAVAQARLAAKRTLNLRPDFGDTYATWCVLNSQARMAECEDRLRAGKRVDPDAAFLNTFLSHLLRVVGRFEESGELANLAHTHDVYVPTKLAWMLKTLEFSGQAEAAQELFDQGARWWPDYKDMFFRNRMFGLIQRGDFDALLPLEKETGAEDAQPGYQSSTAIVAALMSKSAVALRRACPDGDKYLLNVRCMLAFAKLGDLDGAYAIADKLYPATVGRTPAETESIWLNDVPDGLPLEYITSPAAAPMRRDPRYLQLAQRTGLLAYWRSGRLPDFCRNQPEPICKQFARRT